MDRLYNFLNFCLFSFSSPHHCADMIIGRNLQDRFVFARPCQPTYFLAPSLSMIRTKLGLVISGTLELQKSCHWKFSPEEAQKIEATLYPEKTAPLSKTESSLSPFTSMYLNKEMTGELPKKSVTFLKLYSKCSFRAIFHFLFNTLLTLTYCFLFQ